MDRVRVDRSSRVRVSRISGVTIRRGRERENVKNVGIVLVGL